MVQIIASFAGVPADPASTMKIYAISGELVRTLAVSGGSATWDLQNTDGQSVVSGIYFVVLDGRDPNLGRKDTKVIKVLVTH